MGKGPRVLSEVSVGNPVGNPDGVQWMRAPEFFVDPLSGYCPRSRSNLQLLGSFLVIH